jgi:hypothetical protein
MIEALKVGCKHLFNFAFGKNLRLGELLGLFTLTSWLMNVNDQYS